MPKGEVKVSERKVIPVEEGLFRIPTSPEETFYLIGGKCESCGAVLFPKRRFCGRCYGKNVVEIALSTTGKVTTWTIIRMKPPGYKDSVPFVLGEVALSEGVIIRTHFTGVDPETPALKIGDEVQVVLERIYKDENENEIVCYKFKKV